MTTPASARCANPRCRRGGDPEPVYGREIICEYCARRLEGQLTDLASVHDELETVLAADSATGARFDKVAGSKTPPVPVRLEVSDHRDHIRHLLVAWVRLVIEERGMSRWPDDRPTAMAGYLASHIDWLADHPAAGELCAETAQALGRARRLLQPPGALVWVPCPDIYRQGCTGRIPVTLEATSVWCSRCGFETDNLAWLGRLLRQGESRMVTAVDACHRLRAEGHEVKPSTIRTWATRGKVQVLARDSAGRSLYDMDQIRSRAEDGRGRRGAPVTGRSALVDYVAAHERVREQRGRASDHSCVDCGCPADDWAYDHRDPAARRSNKGMWISADPAHYEARCRTCHAVYDKSHRGQARTGAA